MATAQRKHPPAEKQRHCVMIRMTREQQRQLESQIPPLTSKNHWILCQLGLAELDKPPHRGHRGHRTDAEA